MPSKINFWDLWQNREGTEFFKSMQKVCKKHEQAKRSISKKKKKKKKCWLDFQNDTKEIWRQFQTRVEMTEISQKLFVLEKISEILWKNWIYNLALEMNVFFTEFWNDSETWKKHRTPLKLKRDPRSSLEPAFR